MSFSDGRYQKISIGTSLGSDDHRPLESSDADASPQTIPETAGTDPTSTSCCWTLVRSMFRFLSPPSPSMTTTKPRPTETEATLENRISSASENITGVSFRSTRVIYPDPITSDTHLLSQTSQRFYIPSNSGKASATLSCIIQPRTPLSSQFPPSVL